MRCFFGAVAPLTERKEYGMNIFRLHSYALRAALGAVTAVCVIGSSDAAVDQSDHVLDGPTLFSAETGTTNVYSGLISGIGPAIIEGGGTVAFSNPNNSYTGGTIVSNAVFRLDADGCAGASAITAAVNKAHIYMNCANVPNDLYFAAAYNASSQPTASVPGDYPAQATQPLFPLVSSVTVGGKVYFKENARFLPGSSKISPAATVTFANDVETAKGRVLHIYTYGKTVFNGRLKSGSTSSHSPIGGASSAKGNIEFNRSSNVLWSFQSYNANVALNAPDALPETMIYFSYGSSGRAKFDLDGNSQTFSSILWNHGNNAPDVKSNDTGYCFRTGDDKPATVRLTGSETYAPDATTPYRNKLALLGPLTLVFDVSAMSTENGFYQEFTLRKSTTTGDLVISNGDFRVTGGATFQNVPNIYVGEGAMFSSAATTNAFVGCTNLIVKGSMTFADDVVTPFGMRTMSLSLGAAARLSLPPDATVMVRSLAVGGVKMEDGVYGSDGVSLDQIVQGTVVVKSSGDYYVDCDEGDDGNYGIAQSPLKTIYAATQRIKKGDTIHVAPGTYGEAEGARKFLDKANSFCRVIIPEGVTLESTHGAEETFIVGAASEDAEANGHGNGAGAVRCVYANDGSVLRGFTLTGGHTEKTGSSDTSSYDDHGAALLTISTGRSTMEDCIVSNNYSHDATLYRSNVKRCRIIGNFGGTGSGTTTDYAAGLNCSYIGCIIDGNRGNGTIGNPSRIESCTIGTNRMYNGGGAQVLSTTSTNGHRCVVNSVFLYDSDRWYGKVYATNCIFAAKANDTTLIADNCGSCLFGQSLAKIGIGADYKLNPDSIAIDAGDNSFVSGEIEGAKDIHGTPRVLNAKIDIGAIEYDWRPTFADRIGKRLTLKDVSPSVTTNAAGGIIIPSGTVAGTAPSKGFYDFTFDVSGGKLEMSFDGESVGTYADGTHTVRVNVADPAAEFRFGFVPDAEDPGAAIIKSVLPVRGLVISVR